jgi:hypothetical protein
MSLSLKCDLNDACEFHAGLVMHAMMADAMAHNMKARIDDPEALRTTVGMARKHRAVLFECLQKLEEEIAKHDK